MVYGFRYIQIDKSGSITSACANPVFVDGVEITIDTEGMIVPEMPTDAIYALYYNETDGLHWVKVAEFEEDLGDVADPVMEKLESIDAKIQTNEDLQTFYDDIVREVGL